MNLIFMVAPDNIFLELAAATGGLLGPAPPVSKTLLSFLRELRPSGLEGEGEGLVVPGFHMVPLIVGFFLGPSASEINSSIQVQD
jgi:hypothetical protein